MVAGETDRSNAAFRKSIALTGLEVVHLIESRMPGTMRGTDLFTPKGQNGFGCIIPSEYG
jgi:hypothetical protein